MQDSNARGGGVQMLCHQAVYRHPDSILSRFYAIYELIKIPRYREIELVIYGLIELVIS